MAGEAEARWHSGAPALLFEYKPLAIPICH